MDVVIDAGGRVLLPKTLRDSLGLQPGMALDISLYGSGLQLTPAGRTARIERNKYGRLVAVSDAAFDDDTMFELIEAGRR